MPQVPFQDLHLSADVEEEVLRAAHRVLTSYHYILGSEVDLFEKEFAAYLGVRHAVAVASGTDALTLALLATETLCPGSEVILPALTSPFTAIAVVRAGARPVFADVGLKSWTLDPESAAACITGKTVALLPVHLYGNPVDWSSLSHLARTRGLFLLEDACQAHGASYRGIRVGALGDAAAFSFYPTKNLGAAGDGGAITTDSDALAARCRFLRNGSQRHRYVHDQPSFHSRLDEMQAAILRVKLAHLDAWNAQRNKAYRRYREGIPAGAFPEIPTEATPAVHLAVVGHEQRDRLRGYLSEHGIGSLIHYPVPLPAMPAFAGYSPPACPNAERICSRLVSLPLYPGLSESDQDRVLRAVREFRADA